MTKKTGNIIQIFFLILIFECSQGLLASIPNFRFDHLSTASGLSHNTVIEILQDSQGFLWFGTLNGLDRYDGYDFTGYRPVVGDSLSLCNNVINALYEDSQGVLWIGTLNGLNRYNPHHDNFERILHHPENPNSLVDNRIRCITEDYTGQLWIGTESGISCYDPKTTNFQNFLPDKNNNYSLSNHIIHDIYEDSRHQIWIATEGGVNKFNRNTGTFSYFPHESANSKKYGVGAAICINEDKWGNLWVGTWGDGLQRLDIISQSFNRMNGTNSKEKTLCCDVINDILIDKEDRMWICSYDAGLFVVPQIPRNPATSVLEDVQHYTYDPNNETGIQSNAIWDIFMDKTGVIWIGNESGGINKCDTKQSNILHYQSQISNSNSLSNNHVTSFHEDYQGNIWIGTRFGGLNKFYPTKEKFQHFSDKALSTDAVLCLAGNEKNLWIGTDGNGLNRLNFETGTFDHFTYDENNPASISANSIFSLCIDSQNRLWLGSWGGGLSRLNPDGQSFTHYPVDKVNIRTNVVTSIAEDTSGALWLGTYGKGLVYFEPASEKMLFFQHDESNLQSLGHNNINTVFISQQGTLWISTMGAGINYLKTFDPSTGSATFGKYDETTGLPDNIIECITEDNDGFLWMGTSHGVARLNPIDGKILNFNSSDGFGQDVFHHEAAMKTKTGLLYFGGIKGFNVFHPSNLSYNPNIPEVVITKFQIFNENISPGTNSESKLDTSIFVSNTIDLTYKDNVFSFEFAALDYSCPSKNQYAYMMEGFDNQWRETTAARRFVTYTNLPHGNYTFRVIASNNHNQWNREGAKLKIKITPPFWKTDWMLGVYIFMILGAILLIRLAVLIQERNRAQIEMERLKAEKVHEIDQLKLRFFTHISHEFRTPLTLIIGPIERMIQVGDQINQKKRDIYNQLVLQNARRLLRLINQLMDARKLDTGSMKLELQEKDFIPFSKAIYSVFHHHADQKKIRYTFQSPLESLTFSFDPDKIEKVLFNLISNALKFTRNNGSVEVSVTREPSTEDVPDENFICVKVSDTGIGIEADQIFHIFDPFYQVSKPVTSKIQGSGIGLSITKDFVEMHGGKIYVESTPEAGSVFTFLLPEKHLPSAKNLNNRKDNNPERDSTAIDTSETCPSSEKANKKGKPLILTVEDDKDLRQYLTLEIEDKYTIIQAKDGLSGYETAVERIPDLIISDVMMEVMDGYEFCQRCKNDQRTSHIPIILLTAHTADEKRKEGFKAGADDFITKPFNPEMLQLRIGNLLETRKKMRERFGKMVYANPQDIPISSPDEQFLNKIIETVEQYLSDTGFSVDDLSYHVGLSRAQLYRKMQGLFDHSPSEFIKTYRLQRAMQLLEKGHTPSQVCYQIGFRDPSYFSKCFRKEFGKTPQQILNRK